MDENVIKIEFQNGRATIALEERETSAEEWFHCRQVAFSELRKDGLVPEELIDLVAHFKERTPVQLYLIPGQDESGSKCLQIGVKVIGAKPKRDVVADVSAASKIENEEENDAMSASEALALLLRILLGDLKFAEKQPGAAPVRQQNLPSRGLIGEIAQDLLESCGTWNYSPGPELIQLFRELLNRQSYKAGTSREFDARRQAIWITAQQPDISARALAKEVKSCPQLSCGGAKIPISTKALSGRPTILIG